MFEKASRQKLRFNYKGLITVEDLWDLNLEQLSELHEQVSAKVQPTVAKTLLNVEKKTKEQAQNELRIELITYVFNTKQEEAEARKEKVVSVEKKRRIEDLINRKKEAVLEEMTVEELEALKKTL